MNIKRFAKKDFYTGIGMMVFSVVCLTQTAGLRKDVAAFPIIILVFCLAMGVLTTVSAFIKKKATEPEAEAREEDGAKNKDKKGIIPILLVVFALVMMALTEILGLYTCLFLILYSTYLYIIHMTEGLRPRSFVKAFVVILLMLICVYVMFNVLLNVVTPKGLFY